MTTQAGRGAPDAWGIVPEYRDALGTWHRTTRDARRRLIEAMGGDPEAADPADTDAVRVIRAGATPDIGGAAELRLEDGTTRPLRGRLPADLPTGYHDLLRAGGARTRLIVSPGRCHLPPGLRIWGWAAQLYAARSGRSWGMGDLGDLRELARWSAGLGAGIVLVNPLHAVSPILPQQASPYYPSSRRFRNPLYIRVEDVPGAAAAGAELDRLSAAGRALNAERIIRRDAIFPLKMEALALLWSRFAGDAGFDRYRRELARPLEEFAAFAALAEHHGHGWHAWPEEHRHPDSAAVRRFAEDHADRVRFHAWLQWLLDEQLRRAAAATPVMQDLPIGVDPDGADAWAWQDELASGVAIGAPPDLYQADGQNWGLPPFVPHRLRAAGYEPFIQSIRATLRRAGGLRIDHVMGLFRLYWIPGGSGAADGAYVRYPADDLLAIVALESQRAGAFVVGEDLGTVEEGVREQLAASGVLSYRLVWFEDTPPAEYPAQALAAITTHDLPTVAGLWTRQDIRAQQERGLRPNAAGLEEIR
ncbi:MAG: 4-alpha-glucanotransferase, partial [Gemmataceae bacterium]|nr:4-alpha-glucanotransferase [Gemmataceae bacterium]